MRKYLLIFILFITTVLLIVFSLYYEKSIAVYSNESVVVSPQPDVEETKYLKLIGYQPVPDLTAQSIKVYDLTSDTLLFEKNPDLRLYPASTVKIMTALVAMDQFLADQILQVDKVTVDGQKMDLIDGEKMSVGSLLYGLLMYSANDAAEVLAQSYPGGRESFIQSMNNKANQLGLINTFYDNPTGLDSMKQYTCASDLMTITRYAINNPLFAEIVSTKDASVKSVDGKVVHNLSNLNQLLDEVDGVLGVKTGWTENAKENLITLVEREGAKIIIVVLSSDDRFGETKSIIDWVFTSYQW